ncbi:hypothetical protein EK0264_03640 [Epidermidibacterium keratini]|uniref:Uncharacterized protein n=1 Tax=Epidermidibacterium keratini TaxID=1891644 RepID=A0A7L4YKQ8_9ACTN|nr:hypothetical protein [Epidermidibacterium keratini]QHB99462.1 hypothetical protein EK0264_03640 [Epidermidibacterium keratini]
MTAVFNREVILAAIKRVEAVDAADAKRRHRERTQKWRDDRAKTTKTTKAAMQQYREWIKVLQAAVDAKTAIPGPVVLPPRPDGASDYYRDRLVYFGEREPKPIGPADSPYTTARVAISVMEPGSTVTLSQMERTFGLSRQESRRLMEHVAVSDE